MLPPGCILIPIVVDGVESGRSTRESTKPAGTPMFRKMFEDFCSSEPCLPPGTESCSLGRGRRSLVFGRVPTRFPTRFNGTQVSGTRETGAAA